MITTFLPEAAEETYRDVSPLIDTVVGRFQKKYGGDFHELRADADTYFWKCYRESEMYPDMKFEHLVRQYVWFNLLDAHRTEARRHRIAPVRQFSQLSKRGDEDQFDAGQVPDRPHGRLSEILDSLAGDAAAVVRLVADTPADLAAMVAAKGGQNRNFRTCIREWLSNAGWTGARIAEAFAEVRAVLEGA